MPGQVVVLSIWLGDLPVSLGKVPPRGAHTMCKKCTLDLGMAPGERPEAVSQPEPLVIHSQAVLSVSGMMACLQGCGTSTYASPGRLL